MIEKHRRNKVAEFRDKGNKEFERLVENGKITFDHTGKKISIKQMKVDNLPSDFKEIMEHNVETIKPTKGKVKKEKDKKKESAEQDDEKDEEYHPQGNIVNILSLE